MKLIIGGYAQGKLRVACQSVPGKKENHLGWNTLGIFCGKWRTIDYQSFSRMGENLSQGWNACGK